jgi:hypothetical protein
MTEELKEAQATHTTRPTTIDGELLEMAACGGEKECSQAFKLFAGMSLEELRRARRAAWRLEEWCDSYIIGNGQEL